MHMFRGRRSESSIQPSMPPNAPAYGIKAIVEPEDAALDVVLVHGLTGGREKTWTHEDGTFWPRDFLPTDFPKARVLTFGYDADVTHIFGQASTNTLRNHGITLCTDLSMFRLKSSSNMRPIVFIAHSLGGLVCEQALHISYGSPEPYYQCIIEHTVGILFMGTPHAGADLAAWLSVLTNLAKLARQVNQDIVEVLKPGSQVLAGLQQEFHRMLEKRRLDGKPPLKIFCIWEELPVTGVGMVVERHSAILPQYACIGVHGNHMEITKFSKNGDGYERVRDQLWVWINVEMSENSQRLQISSSDFRDQWNFPFRQHRQSQLSNTKMTEQRVNQMANLTWQLYNDCNEIFQLKTLCHELGELNLQFRKAEDYVSQGVLSKLMQDMLMNMVDGCYAILKELKQQTQQYKHLESTAQRGWNDVVWGDEQIQWRESMLTVYGKGLSAMNADFSSESRSVIVRKFLSFIEDVKSGKIDGSELSQSLDFVTAEDGESELVWKTLRGELELSGISTNLIEKHRGLITAKFKELLESGELNSMSGDKKDTSTHDEDSDSDEEIDAAGSEMELDISDNERFFLLASKGRTRRLSAMIQKGTSPDIHDAHGHTVLHVAAIAGRTAMAEMLLDSGVNTAVCDSQGWTAARQALENGHHAVLRAIINHDSDSSSIDAKVDRMGHVLLHLAASYGDDDSVMLLLTAGANPNAQNWLNQTPLHLAAWRRDFMVLKHLLDAESDLNIEDFWGDTALEVAINSPVTTTDKIAVIRQFLEARQERDQSPPDPDIDLDDAVEFLAMESIYDCNSEDNIFKASVEGRSIAELLPKQFPINDLAEDLFEKLYGKHRS